MAVLKCNSRCFCSVYLLCSTEFLEKTHPQIKFHEILLHSQSTEKINQIWAFLEPFRTHLNDTYKFTSCWLWKRVTLLFCLYNPHKIKQFRVHTDKFRTDLISNCEPRKILPGSSISEKVTRRRNIWHLDLFLCLSTSQFSVCYIWQLDNNNQYKCGYSWPTKAHFTSQHQEWNQIFN